jgi:hypothetical protein
MVNETAERIYLCVHLPHLLQADRPSSVAFYQLAGPAHHGFIRPLPIPGNEVLEGHSPPRLHEKRRQRTGRFRSSGAA